MWKLRQFFGKLAGKIKAWLEKYMTDKGGIIEHSGKGW